MLLAMMLTTATAWAQEKKDLSNSPDITVTVVNPDEIVYSGNAQEPEILVMDGEKDITDQCDFRYYNNTDAGDKDSTNPPLVIIEAKATSNDYESSTSVNFTIHKKPVTIDNVSVQNKTYDGTPDADIESALSDDIVDNDDVEITGIIATFDDANAGVDKEVTLNYSEVSLTGTDSNNYELKSEGHQADALASILPKQVDSPVITVENESELIYSYDTPLTPEIVVKESDAEDAHIIAAEEYTVTFKQGETVINAENLIHSGNYTVYITDAKTDDDDTGNYTFEEVSKAFVISPRIEAASYPDGEVDATVLEGNETTLSGGWYVCKTTLAYDHTVTLNGEVNIIIADGATMAIGTADSPVSGKGLSANNNLNIFGQSAGTGVLRTNSSDNGIYVTNGVLTITNCTVDVVCSGNGSYGIYAPNGITINGISDGTNSVTVRSGQNGIYSIGGSVAITYCNVTVTGATLTDNTYNPCSEYGINGNNGITISGCTTGNTVTVRSDNSCLYSEDGTLGITNCTVDVASTGNNAIYSNNMNFNGGQLTAMAPDNCKGIYTKGTCTLGWANAVTDFIKVSKYYSDEVVMIANGKHFRATKNENDTETTVAIISGTLSESEIASIAGTTLKPYDITGYVVTTVGDNFTTSATPAYTNGTTNFYLYDKDATVTVAYTGTGIIEVDNMSAIDFSDNHTFTMPAYDVMLTSNVLDNNKFALANSSFDYNAAAQVPGIKYNNDDFHETYYTLSYLKDDQSTPTSQVQNPGNYAVTLTGRKAYIGTVNLTDKFVINPSSAYATTLYAANSMNQWMTWCGTEELVTPEEDVTVYTVSGIDGSSVTLNEFTGTATFGTQTMKVIPAYTPVLLYRSTAGDDAVTAMFNAEGTVPATGYEAGIVQETIGSTDVTILGNTSDDAYASGENNIVFAISDDNDYLSYVLRSGNFVAVDEDGGIASHRCWLNVKKNSTNGARMLSINTGGENTGIETTNFTNCSGAWYGIDGRKLDKQPTKKGLYINNGKKYVIK